MSTIAGRIRFTVIENRVAATPDDNLDPVIAIAWSTAAQTDLLRVGKGTGWTP